MLYQITLLFTLLVFVSCSSKSHEHEQTTAEDNVETAVLEEEPVVVKDSMLLFKNNFFVHKYPSSWTVDSLSNDATLFNAHVGTNPYDMVSWNTMLLIKPKNQSLIDFAAEFVNVKMQTSVPGNGLSSQISDSPYDVVKSFKRMSKNEDVAQIYFIALDQENVVAEMFFGQLSAMKRQEENLDSIYQSVDVPKKNKHKKKKK